MSGAKKRDLPEEIRPMCGLPFRWRKKWRGYRESVVYRSRRCRSAKMEAG